MKRIHFKATAAVCLLSTIAYANAQHVHGQGKVFIAQDNSDWQIEFVFPAADVLGFEHKPETAAQRAKVEAASEKFSDLASMMKVNDSCQVITTSISIPEMFTDFSMVVEKGAGEQRDRHVHDDDGHEGHKHDDDGHEGHEHDDDGHEGHEHGAEVHKDIEVSYILNCSSNVNEMTFTVFETFSSLEKMDANWVVGNAQGAKSLMINDNRIVFN